MSRWAAIALAGALGCASHATRPSPLAPSHATAPRVATFAPTATRRPETRTAAVSIGDAPRGGAGGIVQALRAHQGSLHRCYQRALEIDPALGSVRVPLRVKVDARGTVDFARADGGSARLDACVAAVAKRISLPAGAPLEILVPLRFTASD